MFFIHGLFASLVSVPFAFLHWSLVCHWPGTCTECGYMSSQAVCKACVLLDGYDLFAA
jgi:hypothetical protein